MLHDTLVSNSKMLVCTFSGLLEDVYNVLFVHSWKCWYFWMTLYTCCKGSYQFTPTWSTLNLLFHLIHKSQQMISKYAKGQVGGMCTILSNWNDGSHNSVNIKLEGNNICVLSQTFICNTPPPPPSLNNDLSLPCMSSGYLMISLSSIYGYTYKLLLWHLSWTLQRSK